MAREQGGSAMARKRDDNFPETEPKAELKSPDRRHLLGAAAAAAFTVGQAGSAAAKARPKKPRVGQTAQPMCPNDPPTHPNHGGGTGQLPSTYPRTLPALKNDADVLLDAQAYKEAVKMYASGLRQRMGLTDADFDHMIRIKYKGPPVGPKSADCGCGCS
jgi:hypothetical protein